ncbi:MAG: hypothetical protein IJR65_02915 [Oscillospiraceae bacterium]|nr:hypothetical protein [Oscillospiraceae bacterium]
MMKRFFAILLAFSLGASLCGCGTTTTQPTLQPTDNGSGAPRELASAVYPDWPEYPDEQNYDQKKWEAWSEANRERRMTEIGNESALRDWYARSLALYLGGEEGENKVYSPVNIYLALAMCAELCAGESRAQILDLLGTESLDALRVQAGAVWKRLYQNDGATVSIPAASFWLNEQIDYRQDTLDKLAQNYYASSHAGQMGDPAYDQMLRDWLNEQTGGLLSQQAEGLRMNPKTVLALAATLYYKSMWTNRFSSEESYSDTFHGAAGDTRTEYLHRESSGSYYWGERFSAVGQQLEGGMTMWFLLPDEGVTPEALTRDLEALTFLLGAGGEWENQKFLRIDCSLPKFDVSADLDLSDGLKAMGVTDVFDPKRSDFSPLCENADGVCLSAASHAARVKIDEDGVEAAAYTVMLYAGSAMPPDELIEFKVDRPFLFALSDGAGLLSFVGIVSHIG